MTPDITVSLVFDPDYNVWVGAVWSEGHKLHDLTGPSAYDVLLAAAPLVDQEASKAAQS